MSVALPTSTCSIHIKGLGDIKGWQYANGVRQFCGIPYAVLEKRWTRSHLRTFLDCGSHDGTKLGPRCPHPETEGDDIDVLTPVPPLPHFNTPLVDEKAALVMNIVLPPENIDAAHPIFVYVHGGSLLYGGAYLAIFDAVKLVSQSIEEGMPLVAINFNYRVGIGGFLASKLIQDELIRDGHSGCGNFGLTDQQVAFEWIQRYGVFLGGDITNVTVCGESAGGISISNQLLAKQPSTFHQAICMSGLAYSIPAWTMKEHEASFRAVCAWFGLDPLQADVLDCLRRIPEQELANATPMIQGVLSGTGNTCLDGWFHQQDPREIHPAPSWLKSYMIGDVYHEGVIFHLNIMNDTFELWRDVFTRHVQDNDVVEELFRLYELSADVPHELLLSRFEHMAGDAIFRIPNYLTAKLNRDLSHKNSLFMYHFDQRSKLKNVLEGTAYHAYELLYLFRNLEQGMTQEERSLAKHFASAFINFASGSSPWFANKSSVGDRRWMLWGPDGKQTLSSEQDDEETRQYTRFEAVLNIGEPGVTWHKWVNAIDAIVNKRWQLGLTKR